MWRLHQFPLCPFSRKVRLLMSEKGIAYELERADPWAPSEHFLDLSQVGRTPMLEFHEVRDGREKHFALCDSRSICEYFEETVEQSPLINGGALQRAEIRRLVALFDENLYGDVTAPLMHERMRKRIVLKQSPDSRILREAMKLAHRHLDYIDWLVDNRSWLAGPQLSLADFAAAAHLSVADYLDGLDWKSHNSAREWYSTIKSRPSFRPLLAERMDMIHPPAHYADPDS